MSVSINHLKYIRLKAYISILPSNSLRNAGQNHFRIFKQENESLDEDSFYSPYFGSGATLTLGNHYGDRINAMNAIMKNIAVNSEWDINIYLSYDFRFTVPNIEYTTKNAFWEIKKLIENSLWGTELYLSFMVSHFNQLIGKTNRLKPEHYHILISSYNKNMNIKNAIDIVEQKLSKHLIIENIIVSI